MGSLAFTILLSGIIAAHAGVIDEGIDAGETISQVIGNLNDIAAGATEAASKFAGKTRKVGKEANKDIDVNLKKLNENLRSNIEGALLAATHSTADRVSECLLDNEKETAYFIESTFKFLGKCVSSSITSITKSIQKLVVAADVASKAANVYTDKIDKCKHKKEQTDCLFNVLHKAKSTVKELGITTTTEVTNIGTKIASLKEDIAACTARKLFFANLKSVVIGLGILRCEVNT